jgi:hypothetical protein
MVTIFPKTKLCGDAVVTVTILPNLFALTTDDTLVVTGPTGNNPESSVKI